MCLTDNGGDRTPVLNFVSLEDVLSETIPCGISDISTATRCVFSILSGCSSLPPLTSPQQQPQHDVLCRSRRQQQHTTTIKQAIRNTRSPITMYSIFSSVAPVAAVGIAAVFVDIVTFVVVVFIENWFSKVADKTCGKETDNLMFLSSRYESWYDPWYLYPKLRPLSASVRFCSVMITLPWRKYDFANINGPPIILSSW